MPLHDAAIIAGTVSTALFVASYLPMLVKAWRTRDLSSYSAANLAVANIGNLVHTLYVVSLPVGPIWALHGFYLFSSAVMMWWWLRYHNAEQRGPGSTRPARRTALGRRGPARACERPGDGTTMAWAIVQTGERLVEPAHLAICGGRPGAYGWPTRRSHRLFGTRRTADTGSPSPRRRVWLADASALGALPDEVTPFIILCLVGRSPHLPGAVEVSISALLRTYATAQV